MNLMPTLYFADADAPLSGVLVSNEFGVETRTTDAHGRIPNPPSDWVKQGARLRVYLSHREAYTVIVSLDAELVPQVIDITTYRRPAPYSGVLGALRRGLRLLWEHLFAVVVLSLAAALGYLAYWWLVRGHPPGTP